MDSDKSFKQKVDIVLEIGRHIDPIIKEYTDRVIDKYGIDISIIVASNIGLNMINYALLLIKEGGGDTDEYLAQVLLSLNARYAHSSSEVEKNNLIERLTKASK